MYLTKKYEIGDAEKFAAANYPEITAELLAMKGEMEEVPMYYKGEIIISFFRDHCIQHQWSVANPELTRLITTGTYKGQHIEALFEACRGRSLFLSAYEAYLQAAFANDSTYFASHVHEQS